MLNLLRAFQEDIFRQKRKYLYVYSCLLHACYHLGIQAPGWKPVVNMCACPHTGYIFSPVVNDGAVLLCNCSTLVRAKGRNKPWDLPCEEQNCLPSNIPMVFITMAYINLCEVQSSPCGLQVNIVLVSYVNQQQFSSDHCSSFNLPLKPKGYLLHIWSRPVCLYKLKASLF